MTSNLLLLYAGHAGGRTETLKGAVAQGIYQSGADCRLHERHALQASVDDLLQADGILLGTPEHFGYMAGALKHFFDTTFYASAEKTAGRPYGLFVSAGDDGRGTIAAVEKIAIGYRWQAIAPALRIVGDPQAEDLLACQELGATLALGLEAGIF
jgi:multimeric flavodoxin WrbA